MSLADTVNETELKFIGKIYASISHEVKNVLAVMTENAGLVEDLCLMTDNKGIPLDTERIITLARRILYQIKRADSIADNINIFAHSMDEIKQRIDIRDLLALIVRLSERIVSARGITLSVETGVKPVKVATNQFVLQTMVWLCLDFAMSAAGEAKAISVVVEEQGNGALFRFTGLKKLSAIPAGSFPAEKEKAFLELLHAEIRTDVEREEFLLILPDEILT